MAANFVRRVECLRDSAHARRFRGGATSQRKACLTFIQFTPAGEAVASGDIEIRILGEQEIELARQLFLAERENGGLMVRYLDWRLQAPAPLPRPTVWGAMRGGKLLGTVTTMPLAGPHGEYAVWYFDTLVASDARGLGLAKKLVVASSHGWKYVLAKGSSDIMYHVRKTIGWTDVGNDSYRVRHLRLHGSGVGLLRRSVQLSLSTLSSAIASLSLGRSGVEVSEIHADDMVGSKDTRRDGALGELKSREYLVWRYGQCPGRSYVVLRLEELGVSRGYAVVRQSQSRPAVWWLVDYIPAGRAEDNDTASLRAVTEWMRRRGACEIRTFASSAAVQRALVFSGFLPSRTSPRFTWFSPLGAPRPDDFDFWHGDGDAEGYTE